MKYLETFPIPGVAKPADAKSFPPSAVPIQWCHEGPSLILHSSAAAQNLPRFCCFFPFKISFAL